MIQTLPWFQETFLLMLVNYGTIAGPDTLVSKPTELSPGRKVGLRQSLLCTCTYSGDKDVTMAQGQACLRRPVLASQSPSFPPETSSRKAVWPMLKFIPITIEIL